MRCSDFKIAVVGILFLLPCLSAAQIRTGANGEPLPTYKGTGIPKLKNSTAAMLLSPEDCRAFHKGGKQLVAGSITLGAGAAVTVGSYFTFALGAIFGVASAGNKDNTKKAEAEAMLWSGGAGFVAGCAAMVTGITLIGIGAGRRNKIEKRYRASQAQPELSMCLTPGGAGLCFRF